ncbi:MAG: hypothetical protein M3N13_05320, partial [Candidatus Eremiobacteraeota bacterium]|nr:hypothetical protein [Candidatus Eremiobacteraeota bacterium]
ARMAAGDYRFSASPIDLRKHAGALDALDREVRGTARADDHAGFAALALGTVFALNDECVGYAYVWPDGRIGPLIATSSAYAMQFFAYAMVSLARTFQASWCTALVPGTNARTLQAATRAGLAIDRVLLFASDQPLLDLSRYVGFHQLAF